jgi:hypothetical protein
VRNAAWGGAEVHAVRRVASSGCSSPIEPGQAGEVVGEVCEADPDAGAHHADGAHDEPQPAFLGGEDVLDPRAHSGPGGVAADEVRRHRRAAGLFALELRRQPAAVEPGQVGRRAVGGVGPDITGGVVAVEHRAELAAVVSRRMRDAVAAQKAKGAINADVVLVAECRYRDLDLPLVTTGRKRCRASCHA